MTNGCELELHSDTFAHAVELTLPSHAKAEDNYFDLLPGIAKTAEMLNAAKLPTRLVSRAL